jgi:hypothetical protein
MKPRARAKLLAKALAVWVLSCGLMAQVTGSETNAPSADAQALNALTERIQEQHKATMWFLDQVRQNLEDSAKERDQALADAVQRLEQTFARQAHREVAWLESSHRLTVVTAGCIGGLALVVMVLAVAGIYRAMSRRTELTAVAAFPSWLGGPDLPDVKSGGAVQVAPPGSTEQADRRLLLAIERLEKRVTDMENLAASVPSSASEDWADR